MNRDIRYLLLSDIHLGHPQNPTYDIISRLEYFFKKYYKKIHNVDMIVIAGDIFDRLLSVNMEDSHLVYEWLTKLIMFCRDHNVKLRILEGTPSHDWKQVKLLDNIIKNLNLVDVDYKYMDTLDIEYIEEWDMYILYIPDEWKPTAKQVYEDVKNKLKEYNINKVDMVVMHGAYKYQLPKLDLEFLHNEDDYLSICKGTINCGHVHTRSQFESILVPGSFDRLTHADANERKGGLLVTLYKDGEFDYEILYNNLALPFKTIEVNKNTDTKKIIEKIKQYASKYHKVHIRLLIEDDNTLFTSLNLNEVKERFKNVKLTITNKSKVNSKETQPLIKKNVSNNRVKIDKEFVTRYILEKLDTEIKDDELKQITLEEIKNIL